MNRTIEAQLHEDGYLIKLTKGVSMEPMLRQHKEESLIRVLNRDPRKYDVVLFKRKNGQYVLHRVVGRKGNAFWIRGDNCMESELVEGSRILGILAGFYRGETYVDCSADKAYLRYSRIRVAAFPLRRARTYIAKLCRFFLRKLHIIK